jgi:hypothetical protein
VAQVVVLAVQVLVPQKKKKEKKDKSQRLMSNKERKTDVLGRAGYFRLLLNFIT